MVLPFRNLSDDPDQEYFSDGITEDIIIELSRFPTLFVIARHSSLSLKGQQDDIRDVAKRLGVKYVAEGSVRKAGERVRISVELAEAATRKQIWANRYDRSLDDIFAVQDEVVRTIVSALSGRVTSVEQKEAERKPTSNLSAYDYFLRGNSHFYRMTREDNLEARKMFQMAIASDPTFARAHARIAATHNVDAFLGLASSDSGALAKESIEAALKLDPEDSWVRETLGFTLLREKNFQEAEEQFERVLELNPNDAASIAWTAHAFVLLGRSEEAIELIQRAMRLDPLHPRSYRWTLAHAAFFVGDYEQTIRQLGRGPWFGSWQSLCLAAAYAQIGRRDDARTELEKFLERRRQELRSRGLPLPSNVLDLAIERANHFKRREDRDRLLDGLRKAGLS